MKEDPFHTLFDWRYWMLIAPVFLLLSYLRQVHDIHFMLALAAMVIWSVAVTTYLEDKE